MPSYVERYALEAEVERLKAKVEYQRAEIRDMAVERDALQRRVERLEEALQAVVAVADRKTVEFERARAALAASQKEET